MKLRPKLLSALIIFSFVFIVMFVSEAHRPESVAGFIFWMSFGVFAFSMIHLGKNEKYYKQFLDDEHIG